mmetsp:Transcript_4215/g.10979  ORF Transcript_4215/g.10979 Transcript_4215/m.10979 type:complete len:242 (+) Transcript_4215:706-1431(+)
MARTFLAKRCPSPASPCSQPPFSPRSTSSSPPEAAALACDSRAPCVFACDPSEVAARAPPPRAPARRVRTSHVHVPLMTCVAFAPPDHRQPCAAAAAAAEAAAAPLPQPSQRHGAPPRHGAGDLPHPHDSPAPPATLSAAHGDVPAPCGAAAGSPADEVLPWQAPPRDLQDPGADADARRGRLDSPRRRQQPRRLQAHVLHGVPRLARQCRRTDCSVHCARGGPQPSSCSPPRAAFRSPHA